VPVAPAIRPWRFAILGRRDISSLPFAMGSAVIAVAMVSSCILKILFYLLDRRWEEGIYFRNRVWRPRYVSRAATVLFT
jgi:uncharacterized membrane protein